MSKRAIRITTALALLAVMSVIAISLLMTGAGGATAFNAGASDGAARHMPIPAQYTAQCSNGVAVLHPLDNPGLVSDCSALLASRDTLEGTTGYLNWSADIPISDWRGVLISNGRVSGLRQADYYLNGTINRLNGTIPAELGNLANLRELQIENRRLTGAIPSELGNLANLEFLFIVGTQLTGAIPSELGNLANLRELNLFSNRLTGAIPAELGNLADLEYLFLASNQLTGAIPAELSDLAKLKHLHLHDNQLTGAIPAELGNLTNLTDLALRNNQFTGCIPQSLRAPLGVQEIQRIGLPLCGETTDTTPTPTATSAPRPPATPITTPTSTATSAASNDVMSRLTELERQVAEIPEIKRQVAEIPELKQQIAAMATSIARLEGGSAIVPPSPIPTAVPSPTPTDTPVIAPGVTPSPTPTSTSVAGITPSPTATSVAGTSGGNACITQLAGSASVRGSWSSACLSANPPSADYYYARFYTFTLDSAARVTITLSSATAAPYLYLLDGAGTDGAVKLSNGDVALSVAITANLQPGAYTIEATTYYSQTPGDFTLELEIR